MKRSVASLGVVALALFGVAADCQQCNQQTQARRGNVDRVGDAVLVTGGGESFLVTTNPEIQHLRILNLTTERFVDAPNKFFPASVKVGPATRRIAVAPGDDSHVFALDSSSDQIFRVRTPAAAGTPWEVDHDPIATGRAPADLAAFNGFVATGPSDVDDGSHVELFVTLPDEGKLDRITLDDGPPVPVSFADGSAPDRVAIAPDGDSIVVGDAALPVVHILRRETGVVEDIDVGGPTGDIAIGVVDIGDGLAPVALALRTDVNVVVAIKLFRPGFREDSFRVLGSAEIPAYPLVGYVPDERTSTTVCCRELPTEAVTAGQATDAWAAVGMANGKVIYLSLAPTVQPFDKDLETIALGPTAVDDGNWVPTEDDLDKRPTPTLTPADNFGDPPFVPLLDTDETLTLVWEGSPPGLSSLAGDLAGDTFTTGRDVAALGARVGDVATLAVASPPADCATTFEGTVSAFDRTCAGATCATAVSIDGLLPGDATCLAGGGAVTLSIGAADAFVVFDSDDDFLGRLAFSGPESSVALPGATLTLAPAAAGPPRHRGSTLRIPLDPHVSVVDLDLSDQPLRLGGGGFGSAGLLPVAITGGLMTIPSIVQGQQLTARRMQIATGSADSAGLNVVFSCDEAESVAGLCDPFR